MTFYRNSICSCDFCSGKFEAAATESKPVVMWPDPSVILYLAGPMTGLPENNYPAFNQAAEGLRQLGYTVLNPVDNAADGRDRSWSDYLRMSVKQLVEADGVALLPGWERSREALVEYRLATSLGMKSWYVPTWDTLARFLGQRTVKENFVQDPSTEKGEEMRPIVRLFRQGR